MEAGCGWWRVAVPTVALTDLSGDANGLQELAAESELQRDVSIAGTQSGWSCGEDVLEG